MADVTKSLMVEVEVYKRLYKGYRTLSADLRRHTKHALISYYQSNDLKQLISQLENLIAPECWAEAEIQSIQDRATLVALEEIIENH